MSFWLKRLVIPGAALLAIGLAQVLAAQQSASPLPGVFGEVLDVRVVNLEVVVTDRQGIPIRGLQVSDFRLLVDGEEVPIGYFSEVLGGTAIEPAVPDDSEAPGTPWLAKPGPVGTSYLVYIDDFFSISVDRNQVLERIVEDLAVLGPQDRMAVVAYDGRNPEMLSTWSDSLPRLRRVLRRATERKAGGLRRRVERRQAQFDRIATRDLIGFGRAGRRSFRRLDPGERNYVNRLAEQLDRSVSAAAATLRSFAKPPGRKVMLLLSGGWPFFPTEYLYGEAIFGGRERLEGNDLYQRLIDTANLLGYTLYPADVPGLSRAFTSTVSAEFGSPLAGDAGFQRALELRYTLNHLAEETGGRAFLRPKKDGALSGAAADTRSYYWLGFSPARAWDDQRHDVEVQTLDGSYRVRSRSSFLDFSREREVTMAVESELLFGSSPAAASVRLEVDVGEPRRAGFRRMEVPLSISIPLDQVTFLPGGDGLVSQLELRVAVMDDLGYRAQIPVIPIALASPAPPLPGQRGHYETTLRMRPRPHRGVVAIYDTVSGRVLMREVEIVFRK